MSHWKLASSDRTLALDVEATDNGPMSGTMTYQGKAYSVTGSWAASGSMPQRNASAFTLSGPTGEAAPNFIAATGIMIGSGNPTQVNIQVDASSSADGTIQRYTGALYPA
ncbi:MAG: hypothetical protein WB729_19170 [Candidatus Sulfotelmatobacter sp.]